MHSINLNWPLKWARHHKFNSLPSGHLKADFRIPILLIILIIFLDVISGTAHIVHDSIERQAAAAAAAGDDIKNTNDGSRPGEKEPFRYTRLKYDHYYLPILKQFQKKFNYQEIGSNKIEIKNENGTTERIESSTTFYTNPGVDIRQITEDDLILSALNETYMTRFKQPSLLDYDRIEDRRQSSDSKLINEERCLQEITYLHDRLNEIQIARSSNSKGGAAAAAAETRTRLHPELAVLFDSYGGSETGLLLGNYNWLGQWEQCSRRHIFDLYHHQTANSTGEFKNQTRLIDFTGRSCIVSLRNPQWDEKILKQTRVLNESYHFKYPEQHLDYARHFRIQVGACLPQSCDSNILMDKLMLNETHKQMLRKLTLHRVGEPQKSYNLTSIYCIPDESSPLRQLDFSGWLFVLVTVLWLVSLVAATMADVFELVDNNKAQGLRNSKTLAQKLVISLSLRESYRTLATIGGQKNKKKTTTTIATSASGPASNSTHTEQPKHQLPRPSDLTFLHGIKVLIMWPILFGHVSMVSLLLAKHAVDYDQLPRVLVHLLTSSSFYVDWYFCITALITTYSMFSTKLVQTNTPTQWVYSIFHRYFRLMPMYLYVFWFGRSVFHLTGSGALWDYGTSTMGVREACRRESWLVPLTLTPNFHPIHEECIMPAWYIGTDMQFYMLTPPLFILLSKSPKWGWLTALATICLSNLLRFHRYMTDPRVRPIDLMRLRFDLTMRINWDVHPTYLYPQYRIGSYLVGILAGHYIFMVRSGQWSSPLYSGPKTVGLLDNTSGGSDRLRAARRRLLVGFMGIYLGLVFAFSTYIGDELFPRSWEPNARQVAASLYATTFTIVGLSPAFISAALMLGLWPRVKAALESPCWIYMSRLNFFVFLLQVDVLLWLLQSAPRQPEMYLLFELQVYAMVKPLLYALSFIGTILMANPLARLETELLGVHMMARRNKPKQQQQVAPPSSSGSPPEQVDTEASLLVAASEERKRKSFCELLGEDEGEDLYKRQQQQQQSDSMVMVSISNGSSQMGQPELLDDSGNSGSNIIHQVVVAATTDSSNDVGGC